MAETTRKKTTIKIRNCGTDERGPSIQLHSEDSEAGQPQLKFRFSGCPSCGQGE